MDRRFSWKCRDKNRCIFNWIENAKCNNKKVEFVLLANQIREYRFAVIGVQMFGNQTCIYGVKHKARALEAMTGDPNRHRFIMGTTSAKNKNEIHLLQFNEDDNVFSCERKYSHSNEIWHLNPHPRNMELLFTCDNHSATLWQMLNVQDDTPIQGSENETMDDLVQLAQLPSEDSAVKKIVWNAADESSDIALASLHENGVKSWSMESSGAQAAETSATTFTGQKQLNALAWNPHNPSEIGFTLDTSICTWDLRSPELNQCILEAHGQCVRDIDYNPNKPHHIVTGGDDCQMKFWDLRSTKQALKVFSDHTHWIWQTKYNPFHDQLVLSAGSDACVNLWRISSISSSPLVELNEENPDAETKVPDVKVSTYGQHEDSVYSIAWSACDSWVFTSLSYDGRVLLNHVPSTEKYKILL